MHVSFYEYRIFTAMLFISKKRLLTYCKPYSSFDGLIRNIQCANMRIRLIAAGTLALDLTWLRRVKISRSSSHQLRASRPCSTASATSTPLLFHSSPAAWTATSQLTRTSGKLLSGQAGKRLTAGPRWHATPAYHTLRPAVGGPSKWILRADHRLTSSPVVSNKAASANVSRSVYSQTYISRSS